MSYNLGRYTWKNVVSKFVITSKNKFGPVEFFCTLTLNGEVTTCKLIQNKSCQEDIIFVDQMRRKLCLNFLDYKIIYIKNNNITNTKTHVCYIVIDMEYIDKTYISDIKFIDIPYQVNVKLVLTELIDILITNFIFQINNDFKKLWCRMTYISINDREMLPYHFLNQINMVRVKNYKVKHILSIDKKLSKSRLDKILRNFNNTTFFNTLSDTQKISIKQKKKYKDVVLSIVEHY